MVSDSDRVTREGVFGAWLAFIIVLVVMVALTFGVFNSRWQWWMWFPIFFVGLAPLITMIYYFGRDSKKCPCCGLRMDYNIEYCKRCGTKVPSVCSSCGASIIRNAQFCEKCGKQFTVKITATTPKSYPNAPQSQASKPNGGRFCPGCGTKLSSEAKFCSKCGFAI